MCRPILSSASTRLLLLPIKRAECLPLDPQWGMDYARLSQSLKDLLDNASEGLANVRRRQERFVIGQEGHRMCA